jgi:glutamyl-tRNA reductase
MEALTVTVARAGAVDAEGRARLAASWRTNDGVLLETCHRVERYSIDGAVGAAADAHEPDSETTMGVRTLHGPDAVRHAIEVAVGLDSVVLAEDQVLSQLRAAVGSARDHGELDPRISRLMDLALRTGRRARSWLPARRPTLADLALDRAGVALAGQRVLVIGAGRMGELAARAALARGGALEIASRTPARAEVLATRLGVAVSSSDPGAEVGRFALVVVALSGDWTPSVETAVALASAETVLVDLSSPPAVPGRLRSALGTRFHSIDDLATFGVPDDNGGLVARLHRLSDEAVGEYLSWSLRQEQRDTAREVAQRSERIRELELEALWQRVPPLPVEARVQIEQMTERLAARLLHEPLARLGNTTDDARLRVARELFDL